MSESGWQNGRRLWERLARRSGSEALDALSDIDQLRALLNQAELVAVREARRGGRTWTEIATRLGITRQSAWERWRDLDDAPAPVTEAATRTPDMVTVPDVIGMSWPVAQHRLLEDRLDAVHADLTAPSFLGPEAADFEVVDQKPAAGERVEPASSVILWLHRGPGSAPCPGPLGAPAGPALAKRCDRRGEWRLRHVLTAVPGEEELTCERGRSGDADPARLSKCLTSRQPSAEGVGWMLAAAHAGVIARWSPSRWTGGSAALVRKRVPDPRATG